MGRHCHNASVAVVLLAVLVAEVSWTRPTSLHDGLLLKRKNVLANRWLGFLGTKKRCTCSFYSLGKQSAVRIHSFQTVKTSPTLQCTSWMEQHCTSACISQAMELVRSNSCLASFFCSRLGTLTEPVVVGLVIQNRQCFQPQMIWHTEYKLMCENGTFTGSGLQD